MDGVPHNWVLVDGQMDVCNQQCVRQVGEHCTWRFADHKFKASWFRDFTPIELLERTQHLCMCLELLQGARLVATLHCSLSARGSRSWTKRLALRAMCWNCYARDTMTSD